MPGAASENDLLQRLISGQATTESRFTELFRRLDKAEGVAAEARDTSKEIATILREQNALARVAELRAEAHQLVADLRVDLVAAVKHLRETIDPCIEDVTSLKDARNTGVGMARGARFAFEAFKIVGAAGGGAVLLKLFGGS